MRFSLRLALLALFTLILGSAIYFAHLSARAQDTHLCTPPPTGMVSWWPGDGNANDIRDGNNGTPQGGVTFPAGEVDQAFSFDGVDDYVRIPNSPSLQSVSSAITIDMWVKINSLPSGPGNEFFLFDNHIQNFGSPISGVVLYVNPSGTVGFQTRLNNTCCQNVTSNSVLQIGIWQHIASVWDGANLRLYIDGAPDNTTPASGTLQMNRDIFLGINADDFFGGTTTHQLNGLIDEVELFNRSLAASEVQEIFAAGSAGKCKTCIPPPPGMVAWWPGEGNGNDIRGENNGTPVGAVTFPIGEVEHAFNFAAASNSGVIVPSSEALNPTEGITLDAWVNPSSFPNTAPSVIRRDTNGAGTTQYSLNVGDTGVVECNIAGSASVTGGSVPLNVWSHVACTYDLNFLRAYVNGVEVASTAATIPIPSSLQPLAIGKENGFTDRNFDGLIDEAELFNRALAQSEIQNIVDAGSFGKCRPRCFTPPSGRRSKTTRSEPSSPTTTACAQRCRGRTRPLRMSRRLSRVRDWISRDST